MPTTKKSRMLFSRLFFISLVYILELKASFSKDSHFVLKNLKNVVKQYILSEKYKTIVMVDDGSENKGVVSEYIQENSNYLQKIIAQIDIRFSNSMIESYFNRLKNIYLKDKSFNTLEGLNEHLLHLQVLCNNIFMKALNGLTPNMIINGQTPDPDKYHEQILKAMKERLAENNTNECNKCISLIS